MVLAFVGFEVLLLVITELSSLGHHFTAGTVEAAWAVLLLVLLAATWNQIAAFLGRARASGHWLDLRARAADLGLEESLWIGVLILVFCLLVAVAGLYLPSNSDSLVYHLARVEHWIQNRTIAPFATHYLAQVELSPWASTPGPSASDGRNRPL